MSVLTFHNVGQSFGAVDLFAGLAGGIPRGGRIGLVGPNGIGKTTLLRILAGERRPTAGEVHVARRTRIGYLEQEAVRAFADHDRTVYQEMLGVFADLQMQAARLREMEGAMAGGDVAEALLDRYGALQEAFELAGGYEYEVRIQQVLTGLGFAGDQQHMPLSHCSGGQKTRALLARLLLEQPDLLILDEPTNHLDVAAVEWLEGTLCNWQGSTLVVSHDRYFLDRVVNTIWEMSRNGLESYRGNYTAYLGQREERWARRDKEFAAAQEGFLKELDFIKRNIARESSSDQAKGRLRRLVRAVKAVEIAGPQALDQSWLRFTEEADVSKARWNVAEVERHVKALQSPNPGRTRFSMRLQSTVRGGNIVLRVRDLQIGYPDVPLFEAESIELRRLECAALIGPNGTGKTTFLRTLLGELEPLAGDLRLGANLDLGYLTQAHELSEPDRSVLDELLAHQDMPVGQARDYLARFLFRGEDVFKPVRALSGGEHGRLALAVLALQKANVLLLDEPTNHLDIPAQEALQEALQHFDGTIVLVSHDRYLVDQLATQIWDLCEGRLHVHKGNYQSYLAARQEAQERAAQDQRAARLPGQKEAQAQSVTHGNDLSETEARIEALEDLVQRLNEDLLSASRAQQWDRVHSLSQEFKAAQARLEALLAEWEELAQVQVHPGRQIT